MRAQLAEVAARQDALSWRRLSLGAAAMRLAATPRPMQPSAHSRGASRDGETQLGSAQRRDARGGSVCARRACAARSAACAPPYAAGACARESTQNACARGPAASWPHAACDRSAGRARLASTQPANEWRRIGGSHAISPQRTQADAAKTPEPPSRIASATRSVRDSSGAATRAARASPNPLADADACELLALARSAGSRTQNCRSLRCGSARAPRGPRASRRASYGQSRTARSPIQLPEPLQRRHLHTWK
eukprot:4441570-Pleurochrysis_carterae.AAC.2